MQYEARGLVCLVLLTVIGCGHSRIPDTVDDGGLAGTSAGASGVASAGHGGASGRTGTGAGGRSGTSGTTAATRGVRCGGMVCPVPGLDQYNLIAALVSSLGIPLPANGGGLLPTACCTQSDDCGLQVNSDCVPRPASDPVCPDIDFFGITTPGCCIESDGVCGMNGAQSGMGCVSATMVGGPATPMKCGSGGGNDADGGDSLPVDAGF